MKKIYLLVFLISSYIVVLAAPGDTTKIQLHQNDSLSYFGTYTHAALLPTANVTYRKIFLSYTIGKYPCPAGSQYCSQWDYSLDFIAQPLNPAVSTHTFEIARGITPYALTGTYFPQSWTHTYTIDVTDFAPILKDSLKLNAIYSGYSGGFLLSSELEFIEGIPAREPVSIIETNKGYFNYGDAINSIETNLQPDTLQLLAPATNADILVSITGHGSDSNGCSEFCQRYYKIMLNGSQIDSTSIWKKCGFNDIQAQTGTWPYDRGNWCPGEKVLANRHHLPNITSGSSYILDMDLENYNTSNGGAGYSVASYVIGYKDPAFTVDAELEDIISPSTKDDYIKYSYNCGEPMIKIKNGGTTDLNSLTIKYGINNQVNASYTWSGNLKFLQSQEISLPPIPWGVEIADSAQFFVYVENPNGNADQYHANDTMRSLYKTAPVLPNDIIIRLQTNNTNVTSGGNINETSWALYDANGTLIQQRINNANNTMYNDTVKLTSGCYSLVGTDAGFEDGINFWYYAYYTNNPGNGYFQLRNAVSGSIISNTVSKFNSKYFGGDFGSKFIYNFKVNYPTAVTLEEAPFEINVYPNPATEVLTIELTGLQHETTLSLLNVNGQVIESKTTNKNGTKNFQVSDVTNGIYFVKITDSKHVEMKKVLISH